jgi:hemolysin III
MNGVTHGLGMLLAVVGGILMSKRVQHQPAHYQISCAVYSLSLLVLYTSSTFFHSFFALQNTKYIFEVLDKSAIYILIAGSYTPFLSVTFSDSKLYSIYLLMFIWTCCILGIYIEFCHPIWKHKALFSLSMYLGMGWAALVVIPAAFQLVSLQGVEYVCLGGVAYTSGVPFFVRNNNLDHSIWHCFVLLGSALHWWSIYEYVVTR